MKKKIISAIIIATLAVSMTACGSSTEDSDSKNTEKMTECIEETWTETEYMEETNEEPKSENVITSMTPEEISDILSNITEETAELYGYCPMAYKSSSITDSDGNVIWTSEAEVNDAMYYYKDHILVIKGHGAAEYKWREISGFDYEKEIEVVIIDEGITMVEPYSFQDCYNLQYVHFPSTLGIIGENTFNGCSKLNNVTFPENILSISYSAFECCNSLTEVIIPDNASIGAHAFFNCNNLQMVKFPQGKKEYYKNGTSSIEPEIFAYCKNLREVILPDDLKFIHPSIFEGCYNIEKVTLNGIEYTDMQELNVYLYENQMGLEVTFPIKY